MSYMLANTSPADDPSASPMPLLPISAAGNSINSKSYTQGPSNDDDDLLDGAADSTGEPVKPLTDKYGKPLILHTASLLACTAAMANTIRTCTLRPHSPCVASSLHALQRTHPAC